MRVIELNFKKEYTEVRNQQSNNLGE